MNRKLKFALAALLGFSAACSSVKNAPKENDGKQVSGLKAEDGPSNPRVVVMYGVRLPDSVRIKRMERQHPDSLPPVTEQPREEASTPSGK